MSVSVRIPTILRSYTGGAAEVTAQEGTLRDVIVGLDAEYPGIGGRILDEGGNSAGSSTSTSARRTCAWRRGSIPRCRQGSRSPSFLPLHAGG